MEASLPVIACINQNNDLVDVIQKNKLGISNSDPLKLSRQIPPFIMQLPYDFARESRSFYERNYQPSAAAKKILDAVSGAE